MLKKTLKYFMYFILFSFACQAISDCCGCKKNTPQPTNQVVQAVAPVSNEPYFKLMDAATGGSAYLINKIGAPVGNKIVKKKFPCEDGTCNKVLFANESYGYFAKDSLFILHLNDSNLYFNDNAIGCLGLQYKEPDRKSGYAMIWFNYNGWKIAIYSTDGQKVSYLYCERLSPLELAEHEMDKGFNKNVSGWDGSFRPLVKSVSDNMNDPSSFEHVETKISKAKGGHNVYMKYRGKNAYNAIVTNDIFVFFGYDGTSKVIE